MATLKELKRASFISSRDLKLTELIRVSIERLHLACYLEVSHHLADERLGGAAHAGGLPVRRGEPGLAAGAVGSGGSWFRGLPGLATAAPQGLPPG